MQIFPMKRYQFTNKSAIGPCNNKVIFMIVKGYRLQLSASKKLNGKCIISISFSHEYTYAILQILSYTRMQFCRIRNY